MRGRSVCWCGLFFTWISLSTGERLYPCGADGYRDVEENTAITFYCDQYSNVTWGVTWKYRTPASVSNTIVTIAVCTDTACTSSFIWNVAYISAGNSSVATTLPVHTSRIQAGAQYQCDDQNCTLHIIVPAEVSQPTTTMTRQDSGYTLSVSADVTQVYSSRGLYSCIGQLGPSSQTTQPDLTPPASDVSNTTNRAGKCDVTMSLPVTSGTYPCSVTVTPGNTQRSCGNITIARPPPPTISCPSDLIAENTSFTCRCDTSDIGQPGGRLRWYTGTGSDVNTEVISGTYDTNTLAMTRTVTRHDNNVRKFRCVNNWMVNVTAQSDYTARVAWGPDTVSIQGNTAFYTDTAQSQTMTLTCQANGVNPSPSLTYSWDRLCDDKQQSTCTFKPGPGDDNTVIRCTVTNVNNNNRPQHNTVTLDIKYPPSSAPQISGYSGGELYEGDRLTLTCAVTGADPMVTSVTLTCPGRHVQNPTIGQSSTLEISSLNASDHKVTCVCSGQWARQDYYTLTDSRTLTVYYPPSNPNITRTDGQSRPALEGDTVTLTCSLTSSGNPPAEVTWTSERPNGKGSVLRLEKVGKGDNKRNVTCQAINGFTQHKGQQLTDTFTLEVYYHPIIDVQPRGDNQCTMTPDKTSCHVTEGQAVHLLCDVDSNPAPENCTWTFLSGSGNVLGSALDLASVNRSHSGVYQVRVATTTPVSDGRLPLTAHHNLTVLVTYPTTDTTLTVNNKTSVTVNETETVTLKCQSQGRPTPDLQLLQGNSQLAQKDGGQLSLSAEMTHLSHNVKTQCINTGTLTCRAGNGVGSDQPISVQLYVNCKPRKTTAVLQPPKLNFISHPVSAAFSLEAFPLPDNFTFQYLGSTQSSNTGQPVSSSKIKLTAVCTNTHADYAVSCKVSVVSARDSTAEGFYTFTAANAFGQEQFVFQVTVNATADRITEEGINVAAIVGGITAALVVIGIVAVVCYCIRRKRNAKKSESRNGRAAEHGAPASARARAESDDQERVILNTIYDSSDTGAQERVIINTIYESSDAAIPRGASNRGPSGSPYEEVGTGPDSNPVLPPGGPQPGPSGADNVYSVVNKQKKSSTRQAADDGTNVYAVVDKSKKAPALPPPPAEAGTSHTDNPPPATRAKPQPATKPKPEKGKPEKVKNKGKKTQESEYGNIATSSSDADQGEGTVYENYGFQAEGDEAGASEQGAVGGRVEHRTANPDGLLYSTVDFTERQRQKEKNPAPPRDNTNYASLDFLRMAEEAQRKAET